MTISALRKQLDEKKIGAEELAGEYIDRIKQNDYKYNSFITVCEESAYENAKNAQRLIDSGKSAMLTGIPISVKDNICTCGIRTTAASKMLADFIPPYSAAVIERLGEIGAVITGKTNMDEFAMGAASQTSYFGGVKNPYDTSRIAGGSSGGSAVSVAADMCVASLGSDTGGSVRQPAAFCGVTGLMPTYSTVSRYGLIAFASSLEQIGPIAKSAEDCGYLLSAIAGRDERDTASAVLSDSDYCGKIGTSIKGVRIGIADEFFEGVDGNITKMVMSAAEFYKSCGAEIVSISIPVLEYTVSAYYLISSAEAASNLARYDGIRYGYRSENGGSFESLIKNTRREGFGDEVKRRILLGNYALSEGYRDEYYKRAVKVRRRIREEFSKAFESCDYILTPTSPSAAPKIGVAENDLIKMYSADRCTAAVNLAGLCAVSTPCGYSADGMPVGMSIIGRQFDEAGLIGICDRFERDFTRKEAVL